MLGNRHLEIVAWLDKTYGNCKMSLKIEQAIEIASNNIVSPAAGREAAINHLIGKKRKPMAKHPAAHPATKKTTKKKTTKKARPRK